MTINDFFSYSNDDGSVRVYEWVELQENINKIYILNSYGKKIVQLIISEEQNTHNEKFAQIKIIPYNIKKALDTSSLTKKFKRFTNAELTYHGSSDSTKQSKIHLKYLEDKKYKTIVDNSCELTQKSDQLIPLFSINAGSLYKDKKKDKLKSKTLKFTIENKTSPVIIDFYLAGKNFNFERYFNSMYSFSMFNSMDYLDAANNYPINRALIMQPITSFKLNGYELYIRVTSCKNQYEPYFIFYNNANFYDIYLNRGMMYLNEDGTLGKKISMKDKEKELNDWYDKKNMINQNKYQEADSIFIDHKKI